MKKVSFILLGMAAVCILAGSLFAIQWYYTRGEAFSRANQMKNGRVLLVVGVESCTNTQNIKNNILTESRVAAEMSDFYALWSVSLIDCPIWSPYFLGGDMSEPLPFMAIIDPKTNQVLDRKQGTMSPDEMFNWIRKFIIE
ncbi:hypothetical protein ACFLQZ_01390 [Acidobacteriota bacterium]